MFNVQLIQLTDTLKCYFYFTAIPTLARERKQKRRQFEEGESTVLYCNPPESSDAPSIHWMDKSKFPNKSYSA